MGSCGSKGKAEAEPGSPPPLTRKSSRFSIFSAPGGGENEKQDDGPVPLVNIKKDAIAARSIRQALMGNPVVRAYIEANALTDEHLSQIGDAMSIENYAENQPIVRSGETSEDMYVIDKGQCSILDSSGNKLQGLKKGMVFGEIGFLNNTPRYLIVK